MTSIGLLLAFFGYAIIYWSLNAFQGKTQQSFITYVFPFGGATGQSTGTK